MIQEIRNVLKNEPLVIKIYDDEVIFEIYEIGIPIVFNRKTQTVDIRISYFNKCSEETLGWTSDMVSEISKVMGIIKTNTDKILKW